MSSKIKSCSLFQLWSVREAWPRPACSHHSRRNHAELHTFPDSVPSPGFLKKTASGCSCPEILIIKAWKFCPLHSYFHRASHELKKIYREMCLVKNVFIGRKSVCFYLPLCLALVLRLSGPATRIFFLPQKLNIPLREMQTVHLLLAVWHQFSSDVLLICFRSGAGRFPSSSSLMRPVWCVCSF